MQFKVTDYNKKFRSVTKAEKFFSLVDLSKEEDHLKWLMNLETYKMKHYKVNQDFYFILQDAISNRCYLNEIF